MKRRSSGGGQPDKPQRRKRSTPKRSKASKAARNRSVSVGGQKTVVARLTRERDEALLRETANSEILRLISKSPGDLELVFRTILEHATSICNANFGTLYRFDGKRFHPAAQFNMPAAFLEEEARRGPFEPRPGSPIDRVIRTRKVFHSADIAAEPVPGLAAELGGARSQFAVPMLKDDILIGAISIYRQEVRPFTDKQIALVQKRQRERGLGQLGATKKGHQRAEQPAADEPEQEPAAEADRELNGARGEAGLSAVADDLEQRDEKHDRGRVVEQTLAFDQPNQTQRNAKIAEDTDHHRRIVGSNNGANQESHS